MFDQYIEAPPKGYGYADDVFECIVLNENVHIRRQGFISTNDNLVNWGIYLSVSLYISFNYLIWCNSYLGQLFAWFQTRWQHGNAFVVR